MFELFFVLLVTSHEKIIENRFTASKVRSKEWTIFVDASQCFCSVSQEELADTCYERLCQRWSSFVFVRTLFVFNCLQG